MWRGNKIRLVAYTNIWVYAEKEVSDLIKAPGSSAIIVEVIA